VVGAPDACTDASDHHRSQQRATRRRPQVRTYSRPVRRSRTLPPAESEGRRSPRWPDPRTWRPSRADSEPLALSIALSQSDRKGNRKGNSRNRMWVTSESHCAATLFWSRLGDLNPGPTHYEPAESMPPRPTCSPSMRAQARRGPSRLTRTDEERAKKGQRQCWCGAALRTDLGWSRAMPAPTQVPPLQGTDGSTHPTHKGVTC
jgi:hypothetical protein